MKIPCRLGRKEGKKGPTGKPMPAGTGCENYATPTRKAWRRTRHKRMGETSYTRRKNKEKYGDSMTRRSVRKTATGGHVKKRSVRGIKDAPKKATEWRKSKGTRFRAEVKKKRPSPQGVEFRGDEDFTGGTRGADSGRAYGERNYGKIRKR